MRYLEEYSRNGCVVHKNIGKWYHNVTAIVDGHTEWYRNYSNQFC